jgi:predicted RNA-binding Zn-ribbon protein involved in translation (DUF1610 family)
MKCPSCGTENRAGARFCRECAESLPVEPSRPAYLCPNCGAEVLSSKNFCLSCGASLERAAPSVARPVHPGAPPARSTPAAQQGPPFQSPAAPPAKPRRGGRGCVWALVAGAILGVLALIALLVLVVLWFYFMPR